MSNEKRAPLLSDDGYRSIIDDLAEDCGVDETGGGRWAYTCMSETARAIRDFYEDLITRGELRVVKTVKPEWTGGSVSYQGSWECPNCRRHWYPHDTPDVGEFCVCGSKIAK